MQKNKLKWIKDFKVRPETTKLLEENTDNKLFDISFSSMLGDMSPQARKTRANIKMGLWQKIFSTAKETVSKMTTY